MYKGELEVLRLIAAKKQITFEQLSQESGMNQDSIRRILESLKGEGFIEVTSSEEINISPTSEFSTYAKQGMPETLLFKRASKGAKISSLTPEEKRFGLPWARNKGFIGIENGELIAQKTQEQVEAENKKMLDAYNLISKEGKLDDPVLLDELFRRKLVSKSSVKQLTLTYTGKKEPQAQLGFDISARAADAPMGKAHIISRFMDRVKDIMVELGFEEMDGSIVESTFWCFDALFQPQDHPARDLADTFYLEGKIPLPSDKKLVSRVSAAHEEGWKYEWSKEESMRSVLRTHTTSLSARHLAALTDKKPKKYFAVGRVFRNEATDFKHLAEFHQVEGIIAWEGATFRDLLGIIKEFYRKLGFEKIRFRPSFFPYTEPSLEVEVFFEPRGEWLELGGAGIFRPEVSIPLAGVYPVLAWGLSLERPLMLLLGLEDIRTFYRNDIDFLKNTKLETLQ
jgi:phenylalanyl-tRNA synthetase alpha chain